QLTPDEDELRIEPLLQLPEIETPDESIETIGAAPNLPLISAGEDDRSAMASLPGDDVANAGYAGSTPASDLPFLDVGGGQDQPLLASLDDELSEPSAGEEASAPAEPTIDDLRAIVELNPDDWEARRQLAEALLEAGDRQGGLTE